MLSNLLKTVEATRAVASAAEKYVRALDRKNSLFPPPDAEVDVAETLVSLRRTLLTLQELDKENANTK